MPLNHPLREFYCGSLDTPIPSFIVKERKLYFGPSCAKGCSTSIGLRVLASLIFFLDQVDDKKCNRATNTAMVVVVCEVSIKSLFVPGHLAWPWLLLEPSHIHSQDFGPNQALGKEC